MTYEERVFCFVDILGFRAHIKQTVDPKGNDVAQKIKSISDAFLYIRELLDVDKPEEKRGRAVTQFSDSIVISFPRDARSEVFWTLNELLNVQVGLVQQGMLCRGAVVEGKIVHTDQLVFGPALNEAYELETKAALFPRIILSDSLLDLAGSTHAHHHSPEEEVRSIKSMLKRDTDGMWYIDYITRAQGELGDPDYDYPNYLGELCNIVREGLKSKDVPVRLKYQWVREKLAPHIAQIKSSLSAGSSDHEILESYLDLPDL